MIPSVKIICSICGHQHSSEGTCVEAVLSAAKLHVALLGMPARPDMTDDTRMAMRANFATRNKSQAAYAHQPDEWVAYQIYMSRRTDIDLHVVQEAARDRIMHLSLRVADYQTLCGEKTFIIEQLQKENAELRAQRDERHV